MKFRPNKGVKFRAIANFTLPLLEKSNINWKFSSKRAHTWRASSEIPLGEGRELPNSNFIPRVFNFVLAGRAGVPFRNLVAKPGEFHRSCGSFSKRRYARGSWIIKHRSGRCVSSCNTRVCAASNKHEGKFCRQVFPVINWDLLTEFRRERKTRFSPTSGTCEQLCNWNLLCLTVVVIRKTCVLPARYFNFYIKYDIATEYFFILKYCNIWIHDGITWLLAACFDFISLIISQEYLRTTYR